MPSLSMSPDMSAAKLLSQSLSIPLLPSTADDDSDEWEYEYSATETEVYYLTLDFTSPLIPTRRPRRAHGGRGGYKSKWINPGLGRPKRQLNQPPVISLPKVNFPAASQHTAEEDAEDEDLEAEAEAEVESPEPDNTGAESTESEQAPEVIDRPEKIQILDLHSGNPIISYKGHTFSCDWAENIGTELLFTAHDPENPLPTLRSLPDNVDLLAASSARLISTLVRVSPRRVTQEDSIFQDPDSDCELYHALEANIPEQIIPVGSEASKPRKEQAMFLEGMMDIKQENGEDDDVTIISTKRLTNNAWYGQLRHKKDEERAELKRIIRQGGPAVDEVKQKLNELMREEAKLVRNEQERKRLLNEREREKSSKRARAGMARRPRGGLSRFKGLGSYTQTTTSNQGLQDEPQAALSTSTPRSWDDLQHGSGESESTADMDDTDLSVN